MTLSTQLWCVHIQGPDDMVAQPTEEAARKYADDLNAWVAKKERHPYDPHIAASAVRWPYSAESHARSLLGIDGPHTI